MCLTIGKTALKNDNRNINIVSSPVPVVPTGDTTCTTTAVYTSRRAYYYDYRRRYRGVLSPRRGGIPSTLRDAAAEGLRVSFLLVERPAAHRVTARATRPRRTPPPPTPPPPTGASEKSENPMSCLPKIVSTFLLSTHSFIRREFHGYIGIAFEL